MCMHPDEDVYTGVQSSVLNCLIALFSEFSKVGLVLYIFDFPSHNSSLNLAQWF